MQPKSGHAIFLIITIIITLLPLILGLCTWSRLPERVAIHFGLDGKPDGWAPKWVAVFALPLSLLAVQLILYLAMRFTAASGAVGMGFYRIIMLIVPLCAIVCTVVIYTKALK